MTWGSHCTVCGRGDCGWAVGNICEGSSPKPPEGYRVRPQRFDFGIIGYFYYIEAKRQGWFRTYWEEVEGTRAPTPAEAIELLKLNTHWWKLAS